jgi:hypothetical protein
MRDMEIEVIIIVIIALIVCCFSLLTNVIRRGTKVYQCQGFARVLNNPILIRTWPFKRDNTRLHNAVQRKTAISSE